MLFESFYYVKLLEVQSQLSRQHQEYHNGNVVLFIMVLSHFKQIQETFRALTFPQTIQYYIKAL